MNTNAETAVRETAVPSAVSVLGAQVERLESSLQSLSERLQKVMRDQPPAAEGPAEQQAPACRLAGDIEDIGVRVGRLNENTEDMLQRLEL